MLKIVPWQVLESELYSARDMEAALKEQIVTLEVCNRRLR